MDGSPIEYDANGNELPDHPLEYYNDPDEYMRNNPTYGMTPAEVAAYNAANAVQKTPAPTQQVAAPDVQEPVVETPAAPAKPAYVPPPMPQGILPAMTAEEEAQLKELQVVDPDRWFEIKASRRDAENRAAQALADYQEEVIAGQYNDFYNKNRFAVKQIIQNLPPKDRTNPKVTAYTIGQVIANAAINAEDPISIFEQQLALLKGQQNLQIASQTPAPAPVQQANQTAPRRPALAPNQRTPSGTVPASATRTPTSATRKHISTAVRNLMNQMDLTQEEAERALNVVR